MSFQNHFVFFCKFVIHHSICILWLDSDHSTTKHLDSFHLNSNFSKYSLCSDCYKEEIIFHRKRYRNLVQFYILVFISRSEMHFFFRNAKKDNTTNVVFSKISKNIKVNWNNQFLWWRIWILKCSTMTNYVLILDWQWVFQYLRSWWIRECFVIYFFWYAFLSIWHYFVYIKPLEHIKSSFLFSWLCNLSHSI